MANKRTAPETEPITVASSPLLDNAPVVGMETPEEDEDVLDEDVLDVDVGNAVELGKTEEGAGEELEGSVGVACGDVEVRVAAVVVVLDVVELDDELGDVKIAASPTTI